MNNFRNMSLNTYKLDLAYYYITPGLAWESMLRKTLTELELITDVDMHIMIESEIRGGLSQCNVKHSIANNKYIRAENTIITKQVNI